MNKENNIFSTVVVPVIGTTGTALELAGDLRTCIIMFIISLFMLGLCACLWKRDKDWAITALVCSLIILIVSGGGYFANLYLQGRDALWRSSLSNKPISSFEKDKLLADSGDGPALFRVATYYYDSNQFEEAYHYARKAAERGNPLAYRLLAVGYSLGLGCPVDVQGTVSNIVSFLRIDNLKYDNILENLEWQGYSLSERDSSLIEQARIDYLWVHGILQEFDDKTGRTELLQLLRKRKDTLVVLSNKGYIEATVLLYVKAFLESPKWSEELHLLAKELYQVDCIPTGSADRYQFYSHYYDKVDKTALEPDTFDRYIRDNDYFIGSLLIQLDLKRLADISDSRLISYYKFSRAMYNWTWDLKTGKTRKVFKILDDSTDNNLRDAEKCFDALVQEISRRDRQYASMEAVPESGSI